MSGERATASRAVAGRHPAGVRVDPTSLHVSDCTVRFPRPRGMSDRIEFPMVQRPGNPPRPFHITPQLFHRLQPPRCVDRPGDRVLSQPEAPEWKALGGPGQPGLLHRAGFALPGRRTHRPGHLLVVERRAYLGNPKRGLTSGGVAKGPGSSVVVARNLLDPYLIPFLLINGHPQECPCE